MRRATPVTERALIERINEHIGPKERLCKTHGKTLDRGRYYVLDTCLGAVTSDFDDLEDFARDLDLLQPGETLQEP